MRSAKRQTAHLGIELGKAPHIELALENKTESDAKEAESALRKFLEMAEKEVGSSKKTGPVSTPRSLRHASFVTTQIDLRIDFRLADVDRGASELSDMIVDETSPLRTNLAKGLLLIGAGTGLGSTTKTPAIPPTLISPKKRSLDDEDE